MKRNSSKGRKKLVHKEGSDEGNDSFHSAEEGDKQNGDKASVSSQSKGKKRKSGGKSRNSSRNGRTPQKKKKSINQDESSDEHDDNEDEVVEKKRKSNAKSKNQGDSDAGTVSEEEVVTQKKGKSGRESTTQEDSSDENAGGEDQEYEVNKIIDEKKIRGVLHYLIRWKGYGPEGDTWEPENTLNCQEAINDYNKSKKKSGTSSKSPKKNSPKKRTEINENWNENENFEVVRILDVYFKRDGTKEFLVAWKGYSNDYNSWEPEENMNCPELIQKYLDKCSKAREATLKELRVNRKATDRFTLTTNENGRRLSRRNAGRQRVHYNEAE